MATPITSTITIDEQPTTDKRYGFSFAVITILFFMWGFMTVLNDILIPYLKKLFVLNYLEATLVQFVFFGAYFIGSLVYFLASLYIGDLIAKIGYKNGIISGLLLSAFGCFLFFPAAAYQVYGLFLAALFCLGLGFTMLQIAANPYVAILGKPEGASSRLNLAQGFNSVGTTIAPIIGAQLIFGSIHTEQLGTNILQKMYVLFALVFVVMAIIIKIIKLPEFKGDDTIERNAGALRYPNLVMGVIAIFMYVGGEVSVGSLMINYLKLPKIAGLSEHAASHYLAFYWGGVMIGRFLGAISLSEGLSATKRYSLMLFTALLSLVIIGLVSDWNTAAIYTIILAVNLTAFYWGRSLPALTLGIFSIIIAALILVAVTGSGPVAMWSLIGVGLFNSIMWSNIFTLAIKGLGKYTGQGSSLLIMAILGAAVVPVIQGAVADRAGLQISFLVTFCCYLYLIYYGFVGYKERTKPTYD
ncbi:MAG: sugar MFS transporter [Mucilaginibacter sp.]|uniref:sugar MFS transporter n=1 Tax=Mucilaginibacter sp. TaxID=1882438 RepID=UPI00326682DB